jgi:hypothetical protein
LSEIKKPPLEPNSIFVSGEFQLPAGSGSVSH